MFLVSCCSCLFPIHWSQVLSREWGCTWGRYIWVINNFIIYYRASFIRVLTVFAHNVSSIIRQCIDPIFENIIYRIILCPAKGTNCLLLKTCRKIDFCSLSSMLNMCIRQLTLTSLNVCSHALDSEKSQCYQSQYFEWVIGNATIV